MNEMMAKLALTGVEYHCYEESAVIADWLGQVEQKVEISCVIKISSFIAQGRCEEALLLEKENPLESLSPWFALCELRLGLMNSFDLRLGKLLDSRDPQLVQFARDMRALEEY